MPSREAERWLTQSGWSSCSKQLAVVVGQAYEYEVDWQTALPMADTILAILDDVEGGDDCTVRLVWTGAKNQIQFTGELDGVSVTPMAYPDLASLQNGTARATSSPETNPRSGYASSPPASGRSS